ncbi:PREDICTED: TRAF3-interacting protein 1, partial [Merops nubicus]|uniref:TRAF3-interacting protein 1 n=1 Tax=Merops nubicus TaxID=57421 RepID=UPI0004F08E02
LQAIGRCCLNKLSSDAAVKRILAGERPDAKEKPPSSKPRDKESKQPKPEEKGHKERRGDAEINDRSSSRDRKLKGVLKESEERQKESNKEKDNEERHKEPEREKQERERNKSRTSKQGRETEKTKGKGEVEGEDLEREKGQEKEKKNEGGREKEKLKGRDKDKAKDREREKDRERGREQERGRQREKDGEHVREHGKDKAEKKAADSEESTLRKVQKPTKDSKGQPDNQSESPAGISRQPSTKGSRQRARPGGEGAVEMKSVADRISEESVPNLQERAEPAPATSQREGEAENVAPENPPVAENGEAPTDLPPQPVQRRVPRPSSARPAPPRVKPPGSAELVPPERSGSGKTVSTIIRDQEVSDDEDEQFVVEAAVPLLGMPELEMEPEVELLEDQNHGGLVKRILETKKDYEASQTPSKAAER